MKKIYSLFCAFLTTIVAVAQTPVASITFNGSASSPNNIITLNANGGDCQTEFVNKGGKQCLHMKDYGYMKVNHSVMGSSDNNLIFEITFFDEGTNNFTFQYNANYDGTIGSNYRQSGFQQTGTNTWMTAKLALTDASFRGAQNGGADFRIAGGTYVSEIKIYKGSQNPAAEPKIDYSKIQINDYSEFTGKSVAGYQMWFAAGDENSGWVHWHGNQPPSKGNQSFEVYPDVTEYESAALSNTKYAALGNGTPSQLFNSSNSQVIDTHFAWMATAHLDGVAVQRFINGLGKTIIKSDDAMLMKVKRSAESNQRLFYVCYDISSTGLENEWADRIKYDWVYNIEQNYELTTSPAYARVGRRPVVEIWGCGFTGSHPGTVAETIDLVQFLQNRGCYVICGCPTWWRSGTGDSKAGFMDAYKAFDMLSPWFIGRFGDKNGADNFLNNPMKGDAQFCKDNGIDYMPTLTPGFAWSQWNDGDPNAIPRDGGEFLWRQASNIMDLYQYGVKNMYFAMFDEYDEGTAIAKAATDWSMIPTDQYFLTLSADGYWLSSDYYLRLTGAAIDMQKSGVKQANIPIAHSEGPVYYRNSFESRTTPYFKKNGAFQKNGTFPVDPCFKNPSQINANNVNGQSTNIVLASSVNGMQAKSGLYVAEIKGNATNAQSSYIQKFADAKIVVKEGLSISFAKYSVNALGRNTNISLRFDDGSYLHTTSLTDADGIGVSAKNARGTVGQWTEHKIVVGQGALVGKTITGILLCYEGAAGTFDACFDNILIEDGEVTGEPDLVVTNITLSPAHPMVGDHVVFSATIKNIGTAATPNNVKHGVSFHINTLGNQATWSDTYFSSIAAGEEVTVTINGGSDAGNAYWTCGSDDSYNVIAWVNDNGGTFAESNMDNNQLTKTFAANNGTTGATNLVADGISIENGMVKGDAKFVIYNIYGQNVTTQNGDLASGIYIVRTANNATKFAVK